MECFDRSILASGLTYTSASQISRRKIRYINSSHPVLSIESYNFRSTLYIIFLAIVKRSIFGEKSPKKSQPLKSTFLLLRDYISYNVPSEPFSFNYYSIIRDTHELLE